MILMPVWIVEEKEDGYRVMLGSEPPPDAETEWIPKEFVENCVTASDDVKLLRFAVMTLRAIPAEIMKKNPGLYGS